MNVEEGWFVTSKLYILLNKMKGKQFSKKGYQMLNMANKVVGSFPHFRHSFRIIRFEKTDFSKLIPRLIKPTIRMI